jgi:hypothetical protein
VNDMWQGVVTIATAIVGIAILAVIVSNRSNTQGVITSATGGFAQDILAAVSPVTGGGSTIGSLTNFGGLSNQAYGL